MARPHVSLLGLALSACLSASASAWTLNARQTLQSCLSSSTVPFDVKNGTDWKDDVAPFNLRLPYIPAAIATPRNVDEIQAAVACGVAAGVRVSPKCGGHSYASFGFGGEDGHLVIELDRMYAVNVSADNTATVQGGARLGHVALQLYDQGKRAIPHGTCPGVGISGHVLHGGYGMSAHKHGLALDWIVGATVVLANATVVHCSADEHPDLFWALRGAGSNFGVVAEIEFDTFAAPDEVTYFQVDLNWEKTNVVEAIQTIQNYTAYTMPADLNMRMPVSAAGYTLEGIYYGNKTGLNNALKPLLKKVNGTIVSSGTVGWIEGLEHFANGQSMNQTHPYNDHETFYASSLTTKALTTEQIEAFLAYGQNDTDTGGFGRTWWIQIDLHGGVNSAVAAVPLNATSYAHRDQLLLYQFYDSVFFGSYPPDGFSLIQGFQASVTDTMKDGDWGMYINYADSQLNATTAQHLYWRSNLERLKGIKADLDPEQVFWYPQSVRPTKK